MQLTLHRLLCPQCKSTFEADLPSKPHPHARTVTALCETCSRYGPKTLLGTRTTNVPDSEALLARTRSHYSHPRHGITHGLPTKQRVDGG